MLKVSKTAFSVSVDTCVKLRTVQTNLGGVCYHVYREKELKIQ